MGSESPLVTVEPATNGEKTGDQNPLQQFPNISYSNTLRNCVQGGLVGAQQAARYLDPLIHAINVLRRKVLDEPGL